jgi:hypothetical protein
MNSDLIVFLDNIQRTIVATLVKQDDATITVTKPVILNVSPTQDKKLQVQLYPLFFREFAADRDVFPNWTYAKSAIVLSDAQVEPNLLSQYIQMFQANNISAPTPDSNAPVVKLFDE